MIGAGPLIPFLGFVFSVLSLGIALSVTARMTIVIFGLIVSLFGIIGILATTYTKYAVWRKL